MKFQLWKRLDSQQQVIKALWGMITLLMLANVLLFLGWHRAPKFLRIYVAPNQIASGAVVKADNVPNEVVYAFAFQLFTAINTWSFGGEKDYPQAIHNFRYYLTNGFYHYLMDDMNKRSRDGSLARVRTVTGISGMGYLDDSADNSQTQLVHAVSANLWVVHLKLQITERVGDTVVKDVLIDYPMIVKRVNMSIAMNPWGLALDGYASTPNRIKTIL